MFFQLANLTKSFNAALTSTANLAVKGMAVGAVLDAAHKNPRKPPSLFERMF